MEGRAHTHTHTDRQTRTHAHTEIRALTCENVCGSGVRGSHLPRGLFLVVGALSLSSFVPPLTHSCTDAEWYTRNPWPQAKLCPVFAVQMREEKLIAKCWMCKVGVGGRHTSHSLSPWLSKQRVLLLLNIWLYFGISGRGEEQLKRWRSKVQDEDVQLSQYQYMLQ